MLPSSLRAVAFDAGGTLLVPHPSAAETYATIGHRYGSRLTAEVIGPRFAAAFARQEAVDFNLGQRTDEQRERRRWREIVAEVLDDVTDSESCFLELFTHYARPEAWRCPEGTEAILDALAHRGCLLVLASNFDHRLHAIVAGRPELRRIRQIILSSELGHRKPSAAFFNALVARMRVNPDEIAFVGDDVVNDFQGAQSAGMRAVLYDPRDRHPENHARIRSLRELVQEPC